MDDIGIAMTMAVVCAVIALIYIFVITNKQNQPSKVVITANDNTELSLLGSFETGNLPYTCNKEDFKFMASIRAPQYGIDTDNRSGIDLLCIIDKSGSMQSSNRMNLVKYTVNAIINKFLKHKNDRIGIVTFSNSAQTLLPLITLNGSRSSKQKALKAVNSLFCTGSTALCDGLLEGIKLMKKNAVQSPNLVRSIFLFTDGEANIGKTTTEEIIHELIKNKEGMNCSLNTFGCGQDHNAKLLQSIAEQGNHGMYAYIDSEKIIAKTLAECIGGLMGIIAQNIKVKMNCMSKEVKITNILSKGYKYTYENEFESEEGNADNNTKEECERVLCVEINDIQSEEKRDLLFELNVPKIGGKEAKYELVKVSVTYTNVIRDKTESVTEIFSIGRDLNEGKENETYNLEIDIQCNRLLAANSMSEADKVAENGNLKKAKEILRNAQTRIKRSLSSKNRFCQNLVKDIDRCLENMGNQRLYKSGGGKMLKMNGICHEQQRSCSSYTWASQGAYCTTAQMSCIEEVD